MTLIPAGIPSGVCSHWTMWLCGGSSRVWSFARFLEQKAGWVTARQGTDSVVLATDESSEMER